MELVDRLAVWANGFEGDPLAETAVPGTSDAERRRLRALGGIARALVGDASVMPAPIRAWIDDAPCIDEELRAPLRLALQADEAVLARLYERLVSVPNRRRLGTVFTPPPVVAFMLDRVCDLAGTPTEVVDPGAGIGAFSLAAARKWPKATVWAVDLNAVTLGLLATVCAVQGITNVRFACADYLMWIGETSTTTGRRVILGNPPYTRHQELPEKLRPGQLAHTGKLVPSGLASLSAVFLAASITALRPVDALALVLPGGWIEAHYGTLVRKAIWDQGLRATEFAPFPHTLQVFPGTEVTAVVFAMGPQRASSQRLAIRRVRLEAGAVVAEEPEELDRRYVTVEGFGRRLWVPTEAKTETEIPSGAVTLGSIARVRRGVATGANVFFLLTDAAKAKLPGDAVLPALLRLRHLEQHARGPDLDQAAHDAIGAAGERRWLLWLHDPELVEHPAVKELLGTAQATGLRNRYLVRKRGDRWYRVEAVDPPDLLIGSMSKATFPVVQNRVGAIPANSMYGIYLNPLWKHAGPGLARWLRSDPGQSALRAVARHYSDGLRKIEPRVLLGIQVPQPDTLTEDGTAAVEEGTQKAR